MFIIQLPIVGCIPSCCLTTAEITDIINLFLICLAGLCLWGVADSMNQDNDNNVEQQADEFNKYISELKEWQDNQYNPGYYMGSGRIRKPLSNLSKHPLIMMIIGIMGVIITTISFFTSQITIPNILPFLLCIFISGCLIYGGIVRLKDKCSKKEE